MSDDLARDVRGAVVAAAKASAHLTYERLVDLGWDDLFADEPQVAVSVLFEEIGRSRLTGPALDAVVLHALGLPWTPTTARILYPVFGATAVKSHEDRVSGILLDEVGAGVEVLVIPIASAEGVDLRTVPPSACLFETVGGLDESAGLVRASVALDATGPLPVSGADWAEGLMAARRAVTHELVGICHELLHIAVDHVKVREQFGRPLGANQAVQHRLADARVDLAAAEELAVEAWHTPTTLAAAVAKGLASRALESIATHGQQVLGGIGYTWEHSWRHPLRRGMLLSTFLGAADECEAEVGGVLAASGITRIGALVEVDG